MSKVPFKLKVLKENAKKLKVLYVEDHAGTRLQFSRLLKEYFSEVSITTYADNAIKIFENNQFDLIIASANLPDMETSLMCKIIRDIAPKKPIIIISKTKDADKIIELINIGISGFIETPLQVQKIIPMLSRVVIEISDLDMIYNYQATFEKKFDKLVESAETIYEENNIIDNNIDLLLTEYAPISAQKFLEDYPTGINLRGDKLLSVNEDIDMHINKFIQHPSKENASVVANEFRKFSYILDDIQALSNISFSVKKLSMIFDTLDYTKDYKEYYDIILAISDELMSWCNSVFINQDASDIHYLDKSFLADALMLESLLRGDSN